MTLYYPNLFATLQKAFKHFSPNVRTNLDLLHCLCLSGMSRLGWYLGVYFLALMWMMVESLDKHTELCYRYLSFEQSKVLYNNQGIWKCNKNWKIYSKSVVPIGRWLLFRSDLYLWFDCSLLRIRNWLFSIQVCRKKSFIYITYVHVYGSWYINKMSYHILLLAVILNNYVLNEDNLHRNYFRR